MKIVCLPGIFPEYTIALANALSKKEDVLLILVNKKSAIKDHFKTIDKNVKVFLTREIKYPLWKHPENFLIYFDIIKKVNEFNPNIIHFQECGSGQKSGTIYTVILSFLKKYSLVTTVHDTALHPGHDKNLFTNMSRKYFTLPWLIRNSKQFFVHGKRIKESMVKKYKIPKNKIVVIPMALHNFNPFRKYMKMKIKEERETVLLFGTIAMYKGIEYLIKAEPFISHEIPDVKIVIAGKPLNKANKKYFEECKKLMVDRNRYEIYERFIDWKLGAKLMKRASVVVLPCVEASMSGVIPVAYAFKKSLVVTNVGSIPEIVDNGKTGLVVPPKNPEALAKAVVKLLKNKRLRHRMGRNGYKKLNTELSWDRVLDVLIRSYKKII